MKEVESCLRDVNQTDCEREVRDGKDYFLGR